MTYLGPRLDVRADNNQPIPEQVIKEIREMRRDLSGRLDRLESMLRETQAGLRDVEERIAKIEPKLPQ